MELEKYKRCMSCVYCCDSVLEKNGKIIDRGIHCERGFSEYVLADGLYCGCYKSYEEDYKEYIGGREEQMPRTYEQAQEVKMEKEYKRVKDITEKAKETDMVNHPKHYADSCSIECIDAMQATFGTKDLAKYCAVNSYKYLWRYKSKNGLEDLKKAEWYLNKFDELLEEANNKPYSEQIPSMYVNICIILRKWLKTANTALGGNANEE